MRSYRLRNKVERVISRYTSRVSCGNCWKDIIVEEHTTTRKLDVKKQSMKARRIRNSKEVKHNDTVFCPHCWYVSTYRVGHSFTKNTDHTLFVYGVAPLSLALLSFATGVIGALFTDWLISLI